MGTCRYGVADSPTGRAPGVPAVARAWAGRCHGSRSTFHEAVVRESIAARSLRRHQHAEASEGPMIFIRPQNSRTSIKLDKKSAWLEVDEPRRGEVN